MSVHNASAERREIVAKYDKGREEGAAIDPWEDPQWEVYHKTDRYGFIHDERLPNTNESKDKKLLEIEMKRVDKWVKMLGNWDQVINTEKFRQRIYKGIPNKVRSEVWKKLLKINEIEQAQEGVYKRMRDEARLHSPEIRQIDLDVNRTYRNHDMFRKRYGVKQRSLFHVLAAYSMYNTEVGYCQGMSQVAALLLMYMDEEDAFWGISALLTDRKFAMHGFFVPGFPKLIRYQQQHEKILEKYLPKVKKHVDKHDVHTNLYSVKWFFQCFLDRVPFHLCLRIWDIYLYEGERLLSAMAYNIFKMHRGVILKLKSMEAVIDLLQRELERDFRYPDDEVVAKLGECMEELRRNKLDVPAAPENELPTKPFGLMYNPTVAQVRRINDSSALPGRFSQLSSVDDRPGNGHLINSSAPGYDQQVKPNYSDHRISRPTSRQLHSNTPSVYDNVENSTNNRNNRVRPIDYQSVSRSPEEDHRYVTYVQVTTDSPNRVIHHSSFTKNTEIVPREFVIDPKSPIAHGPKVTSQEIKSQRDGLGSPLKREQDRANGSGGTTVIRIG